MLVEIKVLPLPVWYFYQMGNVSHILNNEYEKSLNITQPPYATYTEILTFIFLHVRGNGGKAKVPKYILRFTLE